MFPQFRSCTLTAILLLSVGARLQTASGTPLESEYVFVPDTSPYVEVKRTDSLWLIGKLDKEGNFWPDPRYPNARQNMFGRVHGYLINAPADRPVYEFRSGRLIPGRFDHDGNFLPDIGGKIIAFKDYRYSPKARRIYNLPGRFVKKKPGSAKK